MKNDGFTLIEVIVTLLLVGIIGSIAAVGITTGAKSYIFAKENASQSEKAQMCLNRISRELMEFTAIPSPASNATSVSIAYQRFSGTTIRSFAIGLSGKEIKIAEGAQGTVPAYSTGDVLIDNADSISFEYFSGTSNWNKSSVTDLSAIKVSFTLTNSTGVTQTFTSTVAPRNTRNFGGAPPPTSNPSYSVNYGCFIATAAYGSPNHPMVLLLRELRDRYLLKWPGGQAIVQYYYRVSPPIASLIRERPWACFLVRLLLSPLVGLASILLFAPESIPLLLVLSWIPTRFAIGIIRSGLEFPSPARSQQGAILLGLLVTVSILSVLGAAMVSLFSTSLQTQVGGNSTLRAYHLAESGYRYTASEYLNGGTGTGEKDAKLEALHNRTFTLQDDDGTFHLDIYPYYFVVLVVPTSTQLQTKVPGGFPADMSVPATGSLKIGSGIYPYTSVSHPAGTSLVTFSMSNTTAWQNYRSSIEVGTSLLFVGTGTASPLTNNGALTLQTGEDVFPKLNGTFKVGSSPTVYAYKVRNDNILDGITLANPNDPPFTDVDVPSGSNIILQKFVKVVSTGAFAAGSVVEQQRQITYNTPIGWIAAAAQPDKTQVLDDFNTFDTSESGNWAVAAGSNALVSIEGNNAIHVTGATAMSGHGVDIDTSLLICRWSNTAANLASAWYKAGHLLSYDLQTKLKIDDFFGAMAGITFRFDQHGCGQDCQTNFGASFLRSAPDNADGIPDQFVPIQNQPMIVLWQKAGPDSSDLTWLAYRTLNSNDYTVTPVSLFSDNVESTPAKWTAQGSSPTWTRTSSDPVHGGSYAWSDSPGGNYANTGDKYLTSNPAINLSGSSSAALSFWHRYSFCGSLFGIPICDPNDYGTVEVSSNGGVSYTTLATISNYSTQWTKATLDISSFISSTVVIRFRLHSARYSSLFAINGDGWHIDDIAITRDSNWSTLFVHVEEKEADSGRFSGSRVNDMRVYFGDISQHGTIPSDPNTDTSPMDTTRRANPRDVANWPPDAPDDTQSGNDYFTLVEWNSNVHSSVERRSEVIDGAAKYTIIRTNQLTTPSSGDVSSFTRPEIGLHTWGWAYQGVYFDDFAIQLTSGFGGEGFLAPIQQ